MDLLLVIPSLWYMLSLIHIWFFAYSLKLWKTSDILHIPMFFGESSMFIGLVFMLFFGIIEFIDNVKDAVRICKKGTNEEVKS